MSLIRGTYYEKSWNGTDSKPLKKTVLLPRYSFPERPDVVNRLPNEDTRHFRRRRKALLKEWRLAVDEFHRQHPKRAKDGKPRQRTVMPPGNYTMTKVQTCYKPLLILDPNGSWYGHVPGRTQNGHIPLDPKDHYAVIEKLRREAYGSGFNPGIAGAEGFKTLKMLASASTQIRLALVALVRGSWRGIVRQLGAPTPQWAGRARDGFLGFHEGRKSLSQAWLALRYGWMPLLKDMDDGAAWLAQINYGQDQSLMTRVRGRKVFVKTDGPSASELAAYRYLYMRRVTVHKVQYIITGLKVSSSTKPPSLASLAGVAWEIVPYSFVCDWVAPIGGYLQALRTSSDLQGTVVTSIHSHTFWSFPTVAPKMRATLPVVGTEFIDNYYNTTSFTRTVASELKPPTPLGDLSADSVFSHWSRAVNSIALLQNLKFPEVDRTGFKQIRLNAGLRVKL